MRAVFALAGASVEFSRKGGDGQNPLLLSVDILRIAARAGTQSGLGVGEAPSLDIRLDNSEREAAKLIGNPLRVPVTVLQDDGRHYFSGAVEKVVFGRTITVTLGS